MSRKNKAGSRRNSKNYKPINDNFCNSVINNSKKNNNLVEDPNNKYVLIYNSDKSAHISREFDVGGSSLLGFKVETKDISYTIDCHKNIFDIVVEMLNFGFTYAQIKGLLNITHKQYETYKPKDFTSMNDFIFILSLVPKSLYRCNDVLHYVKQIPDFIVDNPSVDTLSIAMGITKNQAKKCLEMYKVGHYSNLIGEARKRKAEQKKIEDKNKDKTVEKTDVSVVEVETPISSVVEVETPISSVIESDVVEEVEETLIEVDSVDTSVIEGKIADNSIEIYESKILGEPENSVVGGKNFVEDDNQNTVVTEEKKSVKTEIPFSMEDYQVSLGFAGIPFDFDFFTQEIKDNISVKSFTEYIQENNKEGIANLLYPLIYLNNAYAYSRDFTLAEDKLLETYYKDIGKAIISLMESVIPNYKVRPEYEYVYRIRERNIKCPHPMNGFSILEEDKNLIKSLYPKVKKSPTKYFSWLDSFDLFFYVSELGVGENTSKKIKKVVDLENLDIQSYIDSAMKLKEIIYYSDFWTTEKHELFKEEFKLNGIKVIEKIPGLSESECLEHAKQYKIFQNYTHSELEKMKAIYVESGIEMVIKEFPYRSETALRYKIEEEGWEAERQAIQMEKEIEKRVQERVVLETERVKKEILEKEVISLKEGIRKELTPIIRSEVIDEVNGIIKGAVFHGIKLEMPNLVRKSALKDLPSVLPQKIVTKLESLVKEEMNKVK